MGITNVDYRIKGKTIKRLTMGDGTLELRMQNYKNQNCCATIKGVNFEKSTTLVFEEYPESLGDFHGEKTTFDDFVDESPTPDIMVTDVNYGIDKIIISGKKQEADVDKAFIMRIYYDDDIEFKALDK